MLSTKNTFCPTCRQTTSNEKLGRIFFDMDFSVEVNSADLQQKLDAFAFELQQSLEFQVVQQELREVRQENVTLTSTKRIGWIVSWSSVNWEPN
jgi:hypothetical protein